MSIIKSQPLIGASGNQSTAYNLTRSLRFRSSASAYLNRTPASASNRKTWTWSGWVKRGELGTTQNIFMAGTTSSDFFVFQINSSNQILVQAASGGVAYIDTLTSSQVLRDVSAWYHLMVVLDLNDATQSDRCKIFLNGSRITAFAANSITATSSQSFQINNTVAHAIGRNTISSSVYVDLYLAEVNFVDGQALTPSSFGETDTATGVWKPKKYTGTYGTNGFYLKFDNLTSTSTLGNDSSGNSNTWTVNNISLTSGSTYDSMKDVPTLTDADTANYCVLSPLWTGSPTISNGNLQITSASSSQVAIGSLATAIGDTGKYYFEYEYTSTPSTNGGGGVWDTNSTFSAGGVADSGTGTRYVPAGVGAGNIFKFVNGSSTLVGTYASYTTGDVIGVAFDCSAGTVSYYKNNTLQVTITDSTNFTGKAFAPYMYVYAGNVAVNFGQRPFAYTPPSGFKALNTFNLPTPTIGATASTQANKYFDVKLYTGNGAASSNTTQNITTSFYPDLTWVKGRDSAFYHRLTSTGLTQPNYLSTNSTDAEGSLNDQISALASTYFQVKAAGTGGTNQSGLAYVGWVWNANSGSTVSNTAGTITSTVSANTTAGFSIVTWTGNGLAANIGHGLGVVPSMIITKFRSSTSNWSVYTTTTGAGSRLKLNLTDATSADGSFPTAPTSSIFYVNAGSNDNGVTMVAYCFAEVAGYSKFGSYTGNGSSDGPFIYLGFRPRFILWKKTNTSTNAPWVIADTARSTVNIMRDYLLPNASDAETTVDLFDVVSNGFKWRGSPAGGNANGDTYIYAAFAETPFKYSLAR